MGRLTLVAFIAALFSLFMETEANPFYYNYERLRIGGLVIACLLIAGGISLVFYKTCSRGIKKQDNNSEI
ncbi:FXYD domain-containing ion transport regulator 11 [Kryptolebias marmoratus]|uniref:FXYD domain-containing ion transport regulator n=1 Tax=Kryptolebias marmoratus TaxID=37003 RepID=A0A3Q3BH19_KRYMA|nr:FXYD domain-containing ion transport regulator 11 [Kryptolebias marmoratus]